MAEKLDVIIVGAGSAGLSALREVRKRTDRFVLINHGPLGTTCARTGCMPSKALIEAANAWHRRHSFERFGIGNSDALRLDIPAVLRRVRELRDFFTSSTLKATDELGERFIAGKARLLGPHLLEVNGQRLEAHRIILAPGSSPYIPDDWQIPAEAVLTSDTLFELPDLPRRLAVVGLGAIGLELAQAIARLGVEVIAFGRSARLGGLSDPELNETFRELLSRELTLVSNPVTGVRQAGQGVEIECDNKTWQADAILAATGRRPNITDLGLENLGITLDEKGLPPLNPHTLQIADLPIFLAGDANGERNLLHEATDEGHIAGINAMAGEIQPFKRRVPLSIVFTDPNIAVIGQGWSRLDPGTTLRGSVDYSRQGRARTAEKNYGRATLYADRQSGQLLGAGMCAPAAEHMAHLLALAIERRLTVHDLLRLPFYHPVLEEGLRTALRQIAGQLEYQPESDLAACDPLDLPALE